MNQTHRLGTPAVTPGRPTVAKVLELCGVPDVLELGVNRHVVEPEIQRWWMDAVMPQEEAIRV